MLHMTSAPLRTAGGAVYPWSQKLEDRFLREDRFEEEFQLGLRQGDEFWVPRRLAPELGQDLRVKTEPQGFAANFTPRNADQARVVAESSVLAAAGVSHIVQAPTGYGKTYVGCAVASAVQQRTLVLTTKEDLMENWIKAAQAVLGLDASELALWRGDQVFTPKAKFVVGLVHSVLKGPARYPGWMFNHFGLVIPDEVHRMGADQFSQAMWWLPAWLRIGMSATPYRKDGREVVFQAHIGDVAVVGEQETLIPKVIIKHTDYKVPKRLDSKKNRWVQVGHSSGRTMHLMKHMARFKTRNVEIANFVRLAVAKGRSTVVFADTMDHLEKLREEIVARGVKAADIGWYVGLSAPCYSGSEAARKEQREKAALKAVVLATYKMCSEGTDKPWWDTCVLGSPRSDVNQIVGRIRREYEGKKDPLVFDPVDKDSPVFAGYAAQRLKWYKSLGAKIVVYR